MIAGVDEVLKANLVLLGLRLVHTASQKSAFDSKVNVDTIESSPIPLPIPIPNIQTGVGQIDLAPKKLTLGRDRIALDLMPDRTTVSIDYPTDANDLEKLAKVARTAIEVSDVGNQQLRAFGFNVEVVYKLTDGEQASEFISRNIYAPGLFQDAGFSIIGGSSQLVLVKDGQLWNVTVEPRFGKPDSNKIFTAINLHYDYEKGGTPPSLAVMTESLVAVWKQAHSLEKGF